MGVEEAQRRAPSSGDGPEKMQNVGVAKLFEKFSFALSHNDFSSTCHCTGICTKEKSLPILTTCFPLLMVLTQQNPAFNVQCSNSHSVSVFSSACVVS